MKKNTLIILTLLALAIGVVFRFYKLGGVPNSLNWDEVSWGYNAYSIIKTGMDEHGNTMPASFKAFGDYKQPVYVYLSTIPIFFFGLDAFSTRFISAFFGSISIVFVILFTREILLGYRYKDYVAVLAGFFFAISPWSIQFSRVAFEANVGLAFVIIGAWIFIKGLNEKHKGYILSSLIPLSLSCYTYHSEKIFTPLFFTGLLLYGFVYFWKHKKFTLLVIGLFIALNIFWILDTRTTERGRSVLFFSQQNQILSHSTKEIMEDQHNNNTAGALLHNRRIIYVKKYLEHYLLHFNPTFLFIEGSDPTHHTPRMGMEYFVSLPFIIGGIVLVIRRRLYKAYILFAWMLLAPVAAALAIDPPNASRSMIFLPTWQIFAAFGLVYFFVRYKGTQYLIMKILIIILYSVNIFYFIHQYYSHTNSEYSSYWQYGYEQAVRKVEPYVQQNKTIYFSTSFEQPYIFYLFHIAVDPRKYIESGGSGRIKEECYSIDSVYFGKCDIQSDIIIQHEKDAKVDGYTQVDQISHFDGEPFITVLQKNENAVIQLE